MSLLTFLELLKFIPEKLAKDKLLGYLQIKSTAFEKVVARACDQLQLRYPDALGGDLKSFLTRQQALHELKKVLIPNYQLNEESLGIDLPTLPNDFLSDLRDTLQQELYNSDEFRGDVLSLIGRLSIEEKLTELSDKLDSLTIAINTKNAEAPKSENGLNLPPKKIYTTRTKYYIERNLYLAQYFSLPEDDLQKWQGNHSLKNLVSQTDKLAILSSAGQGKSTELLETARHLSQSDETPFPILIQLNTYDGETIEDLISAAYKFWLDVPKNKIVILFDGLDEVYTSQFNKLIKKIVSFKDSDENKEITLVIACRDNIFPLELATHGFRTFKLRPLTDAEISNCIEKELGSSGDQFLHVTKSNGVYDILSNPFFLNYALALFLSKRLIVKSKTDLFEKFINYRIEEDQRKNSSTGLALEKHEQLIRNEITRVALVMNLLGRNFLDELEFQKVVPNYKDVRSFLERTFLLDLQETKKWQFEHNNFQEYLAAKSLVSKDIKTIREFVAFKDYRKIKPTWVNTLSFIMILSTGRLFDDLLTWLVDIEPELLLRFEKERIDLQMREKIFIKILESFQSKGIATRNEKFDIEQLADYVRESYKTLEYLSGRLSVATTSVTVIEIARMLNRFDNIELGRSLFENVLIEKVLSTQISDNAKYTCLETIGKLGWGNQSQLNQICSSVDLTISENLRAGIFAYINATQIVDQNIDLIIKLSKTSKRTTGHGQRGNLAFPSEDFRLADCYRSVKSYEGLKKVIDYVKELTEDNIYEFLSTELVEQIIENSIGHFKAGTDERIYNDIVTLFESYSRKYMVHYDKSFRNFFEKTGTITTACDYFYKKRKAQDKVDVESIQALCVICDKAYLNFLIDEFKAKNLKREETLTIRWNFSSGGRAEFHDLFQGEINKISGDQYQYLQEDPYTAKRKRQYLVDLDLLHSKTEFYKRIKQVFELEGKEKLSKEDLNDYRKKYNEDETYLDNTIVLRFIREFIDGEFTDSKEILGVTLESLYKYLDERSNWESLQICTLLEYDKNNTIQFQSRELHFIGSWIQKHLLVYNFSERITNLHVWIAYFIRRLDYSVPHDILLNMFRVDYPVFPFKHVQNQKDREETISEYLIRKVGLAASRIKICENLISDLLDGEEMVIQHAELCLRHRLFECLPGLKYQIQNKKFTGYNLTTVIECYLKLGGTTGFIDQVLQGEESRFKKYDLFKLCDLLIEHESKYVTVYLNKTLTEEAYDEETKLYNTLLLLKLGSIEGLQYYANWFRGKKKQGIYLNRINISKLPGDRALPLLFDILDNSLEPDFEREGDFGDDNIVLDWVVEIGYQSKELFSQVNQYFRSRIESKNATWLHYRLQTLEQKYFNRLALSLSIEEAITIANKAFI